MQDLFPKIILNSNNFLSPEVTWPDRLLPQSSIIENDLYMAWIYFVDYDEIDNHYLANLLFEDKGEKLCQLSSDYLIILIDKKNQLLKVMVSLSGQFPLFFDITSNTIILSPSFYEVFQTVENPLINLDETMDYLINEYGLYQTNQTFIQQIRRLPPGCILEVNTDFKFRIKEPFNWKEVLKNVNKTPLPQEQFTIQLLEKLDKSIRKRIKPYHGIPVAADLSSGFDSSLIVYSLIRNIPSFQCYSQYINWNDDDSDPNLVKKFADKHNVKVNFLEMSNFLNFNAQDIQWNKTHFFPGTGLLAALKYFHKISSDFNSPFLNFTGYGGDEFFNSNDILQYVENEKKTMIDFINLNVQSGGEKLFTNKGLELLTSKERLDNKKLYSNQLGSETVGWRYFPIVWYYDSWMVHPFADIEMIKLALRIPRNGKEPTHKQLLLKSRTDIFPAEQFRVKLPNDTVTKVFFEEGKDFIVEILSNSILGRMGLIRAEELKKKIQEGNGADYIDKMIMPFTNILRLEIFFQANHVNFFVNSIPN